MKTVSIKSLRPGHDASAPIGIANVRQHDRTGGIEALADSIAAHGLIAPLVVVSGPKGIHFVADGNRRLAALEHLVATKRMKGTDTVAVVERTAEECAEIGLAANVMRAPLHDADRYVAFANLAYLRLSEAEIAARFGIELKEVRRILAIGKLSPAVLDAWRSGRLGRDGSGVVEFVRVLTLAPTFEEQERVLAKMLAQNTLGVWAVKRELGIGEHDTNRNLRLVGRDAYLAAGGVIVEDLFGEDHRVENPALLKTLADERIAAECARLVGAGWAWAAPDSALPDRATWSWARLSVEPRACTVEELARLEALHAIVDAETDEYDDGEELARAEEEIEAIEAAQQQEGYTAEQKARSGVIVGIGRTGEFDYRDGVIRPATAEAARAFAVIDGVDEAEAVKALKAEKPEAATLSTALVVRLSQALTLAAQDAVTASPKVGLALLLAGAATGCHHTNPVRIRTEGYGVTPSIHGESFEPALARFLAMPIEDLLAAAAAVAARTLDLQVYNATVAPGQVTTSVAVASALDQGRLAETLASRWDAEDYFRSAPKAIALKAIEEVLGAAEAKRCASMTKPEIVAVALARVVGSTWLPPEIRHPGYAGPGAVAAEADRKAA
ncbi:ParB/RepB/Spo0J family partition protein [Methylobacterium sp. WL12]|uniref:ParB/RepB/Spo0J family partition protein n=1 Tax=Methylobacterium sp. WL12 TaxID=2603890 RepID=UPI00165084B4|nr:ParB/RepB/Spo0J family partition protein [Methylobacterium sp. WL12]